MHPARLSYLAYRHAVRRKVTHVEREPSGRNHLTLECGHELHYVAHFDCTHTTLAPCHECGIEVVKKIYAEEFN